MDPSVPSSLVDPGSIPKHTIYALSVYFEFWLEKDEKTKRGRDWPFLKKLVFRLTFQAPLSNLLMLNNWSIRGCSVVELCIRLMNFSVMRWGYGLGYPLFIVSLSPLRNEINNSLSIEWPQKRLQSASSSSSLYFTLKRFGPITASLFFIFASLLYTLT